MPRYKLWATIALVVMSMPVHPQAFEILPLLLDGDPMPGRPGAFFVMPQRYALNSQGQAVVVLNDESMWGQQTPDGDFFPLIEAGDTVPGADGSTVLRARNHPHPMSQSGLSGLNYALSGNGPSGEPKMAIIIVDVTAQDFSALGISGTPAPGIPGGVFSGPDVFPFIADDGRILFSSNIFIDADSNVDSLYLAATRDSAPSLLNRAGDVVLSQGGDAFITSIDFSTVRDDQVVFTGWFSDGSQGDIAGIWGGVPERGQPQLLIRAGDPAPNEDPPLFFANTRFFIPVIQRDGSLLLQAELVDDISNPTVSYDAIFHRGPNGALTKIVRDGDEAPSIAGATFQFINNIEFSDAGHVNFNGQLVGPGISFQLNNDTSYWQAYEGQLTLIAREGEELPEGFLEGRFKLINSRGQLASSGGTSAQSRVSATTEANQLVTIIGEGDDLNVRGVDRTVDFIDALGFATRGGYEALTDDGRLAFNLFFTDGASGIFVTKVSATIFADGFE